MLFYLTNNLTILVNFLFNSIFNTCQLGKLIVNFFKYIEPLVLVKHYLV